MKNTLVRRLGKTKVTEIKEIKKKPEIEQEKIYNYQSRKKTTAIEQENMIIGQLLFN